MSEIVPASVQFIAFRIIESHFVMFEHTEYDLTLTILPSGVVQPDISRFDLQLVFEANDSQNQQVVRVVSKAQFSYEGIDDITNTPFFIHNAPAIAFPYVRAYISTLTVQSGIQSIVLPTLNLSGLSEELKQNIVIAEKTTASA
jgi:preprotein translocase subunit SecB